ncbi:MAG TPA: glycosyltransferase family 9 protein, partial [Nitrolancea sp.]|nr:glycosyltransferase family 9 protein [Nitrolancea sp.]
YVLLHPGASAQARRYPPERFGEVARLLGAAGQQVLLTGVEREAALLEAARAEAPEAAFLAARTTLPEYAALVARAALVVCNNSLPLHLADATGTPLVVLYSGTDRESEWEPRAVPARLLRRPTACAPCRLFECPIGLPCLDIPPREVAEAALALLEPVVARVGAV